MSMRFEAYRLCRNVLRVGSGVGTSGGGWLELLEYVVPGTEPLLSLSLPLTQFKLADMETRLQSARLLTWAAACLKVNVVQS